MGRFYSLFVIVEKILNFLHLDEPINLLDGELAESIFRWGQYGLSLQTQFLPVLG